MNDANPSITKPRSGSEAQRAYTEAHDQPLTDEIHVTKNQKRVFFEHNIVAPRFHGEVADEAAMLALNATSAYGCFPADTCYRADTESEWVCQTGRGTTLVQWYNRAAILEIESILSGGSFISIPTDIVSGGTFLSRPSGRIFGGGFVTSTHGGMF